MLRSLALRTAMLGYHASRPNARRAFGRWVVTFVWAAPAFAVQLVRRAAV